MSRILVAMSGGVDSSVAAALLHEQGHDVVGVWMRLHDVADTYSEFKKSCCSLDAADDARRVAARRRTHRAVPNRLVPDQDRQTRRPYPHIRNLGHRAE